MKALMLSCLTALLLAGCQTANPSGIRTVTRDTPLGENSTRVIRNNPNPEKWSASAPLANSQIIYTCRPLVCSTASRIITRLGNSPNIKPNPAALANLAKVETPRYIASQRESGASTGVLISSGVTTARGYPATTYSIVYQRPDGTKYYNVITNIYAGTILVFVNSTSNTIENARSHAAEYIAKLEILQGEKMKVALGR
jgi:hypothetical protein